METHESFLEGQSLSSKAQAGLSGRQWECWRGRSPVGTMLPQFETQVLPSPITVGQSLMGASFQHEQRGPGALGHDSGEE